MAEGGSALLIGFYEQVCFASTMKLDLETKLQKKIDIPVFHDDQHGTAVVTTAALMNALKITGKKAARYKITILHIRAS